MPITMSAHNANGTGNGNGDSPHYPSPLDVLSNAPRRGDAASFLLESTGPLQDSTEFRELAAARRDELLAKHAYQAEAYRAKQRQLARAEQWRDAAREAEWKAVVEAAPAHLQESVAIQDFDFGRLWAEYNELNRPDQWYSYGGGFQQRKHGANWPFFRNEVELDWYRNASRWSITKSSHAPGFIGGVCGYVINKGHVCKPVPLDGTNDPRDARLVALLEHEFEQFSKRVGWAQLQQEIFCESFADGEYFLHLFDLGDHLEVRGILPELIRQPPGTLFDEWGFGIQAPPDDPWKKQAVHICDYDGGMGFVSSMDDVVYFPFRIPGRYNRGMKRCMPPLAFGTRDGFDHAEKLMRAMGIGVTIRQGFAYFEQWADVPRETATGFVDDNSDVTIRRTGPNGTTTRDYTIAEPGKVIRGSPGMQFAALPSSPETSVAIEVADALLRRGGVILNAPPWLTGASGRDQGAYASDFVRESPAVKRWEMIQEDFGSGFLRVMEKVRDIAIRCGRLPVECRTRIKLTMEHPTLEARNKGEEASQNQTYVGMGAKSLQQIAAEQGWDYAKQRAEIKEKAQDDLKTQIELLDLQMQLERKKQELAALQQPPPGDGGGGAPSGEGPSGPAGPGGDDGSGAPPSPSLPGAEVGGDDPGTDLSPFGDIGESLDGVRVVAEVNESIDAALLLEGFTGVIKDKLGRTYHYQDGKRIAAAKAKEAGIDSESHPIKDAGKARAALKVVLDRGDVSEQHLADIAEHLPAMSVKDLRLMKAALMDRVAAKDKEALIGRVREAAQKRVAESGANEQREVPPVDPQASEEPQQPVAGEPTPTEQPPTDSQPPQEPPAAGGESNAAKAIDGDAEIKKAFNNLKLKDDIHPVIRERFEKAAVERNKLAAQIDELERQRSKFQPASPEWKEATRRQTELMAERNALGRVDLRVPKDEVAPPNQSASSEPAQLEPAAETPADEFGLSKPLGEHTKDEFFKALGERVGKLDPAALEAVGFPKGSIRVGPNGKPQRYLGSKKGVQQWMTLNNVGDTTGELQRLLKATGMPPQQQLVGSFKDSKKTDWDAENADTGIPTLKDYVAGADEDMVGYRRQGHREMVEDALRVGQPVPPEVLADYPDLADKATAVPASAPAAEASSVASQPNPADNIRAVYDSADDLTQDSAAIDAKLAVMDKLDKRQLLGVAEKMELVGMRHKSLAAIRGAIRQKIADRRGQAQRRAMLDDGPSTDPNLGIDDEAAASAGQSDAAPANETFRKLYDRAGDTSIPEAEFAASIAKLDALTGSDLKAVADAVSIRVASGTNAGKVRDMIRERIQGRRDAALRTSTIDVPVSEPGDNDAFKGDRKMSKAEEEQDASQTAAANQQRRAAESARREADAKAANAPPRELPRESVAKNAVDAYSRASDPRMDDAEFQQRLIDLTSLPHDALSNIAGEIGFRGGESMARAELARKLAIRIRDRRGAAGMVRDIDITGRSPKTASGASPTTTPQATPAKPAATTPSPAPASPVASINANVLNPHVTDAQFTKQVADAVAGMNKSQMAAAYKELGFAAPLSGTPEQMKTKLSAAMTARRDQRLRAADGFAPDWSVHQAAAQVRSGEATPEQAAARLSRDIMGQGGDAHVIQLLKEFGIKTPGDLGTKAGKQAAADAIAKAAVAKASEPAPAFTPANREAAPKPTAIDPARYVPPVNRDAVAGVKARQRGPAKSHTVDSATKTAKQLFDAALASDWDEAKVQAEVDGLASLSIGDLNAVWKNLGGSATHANRESALKAIENLIVDRRGKHLRSKV